MNRNTEGRFRRGSFLVEAIIAIGVFAIVSSAIMTSIASQLAAAQSSRETAMATSYAEEGIEAARTIRDTGWDALATGAHGVVWTDGAWVFSGTSDSSNGYQRTVTVSQIDERNRSVAVDISWHPSSLRTRTLSLSTVLTDWRRAEQSDLGGGLGGDWTAPSIVGTNFDFGSNFRGLAVDVDQNVLALAGFGTTQNNYELYLLDVTNPYAPTILGKLNTGPAGVNELSIDMTRHYVYMAYAGTSNQLQIIDISNLAAPVLVKQFSIPGNTQKGRSLDRIGNLVYFGTEGPSTKEFSVIDVTNVLSPNLLGSTSVGNDINDIMVNGDYAYLATDVNGRELTIINVSNPSNLTVESYSNIPGPQYAEMVFYEPTTERAYIGRQFQTGQGTPEVSIYDVSNKKNPQRVGGMEADVDVNCLMAIGNMLFALSAGDMEFRVYDATDPADVRYYGGVDFGASAVPTDVIYKDNIFYVSIFDQTGLRVVTAY
jgi:type II secretory pathway pseudopilin PulG